MASAAAMLAGVSSTIRIVLSGIWAYSPIVRERLAPLRPLAGGEGGTRRGVSRKPAGLIRGDGRVRWVAPLLGTVGNPHLTPTLSAPQGGEEIFRIARSIPVSRSAPGRAGRRGCA